MSSILLDKSAISEIETAAAKLSKKQLVEIDHGTARGLTKQKFDSQEWGKLKIILQKKRDAAVHNILATETAKANPDHPVTKSYLYGTPCTIIWTEGLPAELKNDGNFKVIVI